MSAHVLPLLFRPQERAAYDFDGSRLAILAPAKRCARADEHRYNGVLLIPARQYLLAFSTVGAASSSCFAGFGSVTGSDPYSGGQFVYSPDPSQIGGATFLNAAGADLAFRADFGPARPGVVPDGGSSALLLGLGLAGLLV